MTIFSEFDSHYVSLYSFFFILDQAKRNKWWPEVTSSTYSNYGATSERAFQLLGCIR